MSGHSKWSTIKRKKGGIDAQRGKIFTKLGREIMTAARIGGGDIDGNPRLRLAVLKAKAQNMPNDNIDRAIKKGTGSLEGVVYEEINYEGYGPAGVAVIASTLTDNRNRTVAEIRHVFTKHGGNMGATGSVSWIFANKAYFLLDRDKVDADRLVEVALEAGAEDVKEEGAEFEVTAAPEAFGKVKDALDEAKLPYQEAEVTLIPSTTIRLEGNQAGSALRLVEALEDLDDVQKVYANFDISEEVMESLSQQ
jgi:YebC/PmpR family DNA-binding regulatory protein